VKNIKRLVSTTMQNLKDKNHLKA